MNTPLLLSLLDPMLPEPLVLEETDSTNRVARTLAREGAPHGKLVLAMHQTTGRGRLDRCFYSPEGGLYLSMILRLPLSPAEKTLLTPLAAVAVQEAIASVCQIATGIKWVNDLFYQGKKVCGILAEGAGDAVVLGVGVDVYRPVQPLPPKLQDVMGFLLEEPVYGVMEMLAAAIANNLLTRAAALPDRSFLEDYRRNSLLLGRSITVYPPAGAPYPALARAMDDDARLLVELPDGSLRTLSCGEVSVRHREEGEA